MKRRVFGAVILLVAILLACGGYVYHYWHTPYKGWKGSTIKVEIPPKTSVGGAIDRLVKVGVLRSAPLTKLFFVFPRVQASVKAGHYTFSRPHTPLEIIALLEKGVPGATLHLTIPEGLRLDEVATLLDSKGIVPAAAFLAVAKNPLSIADVDAKAEDLEGYLLPETYFINPGMSPQDLVDLMVHHHLKLWNGPRGEALVAAGLTLREAVTLASIVEKETAKASERPIIAGVFVNRLRLGMPLQSDPTVIYALVKLGRWDGNIRKADLKLDHPYNTYVYKDLPPGPICNPGEKAIDAVLHPATHPYLYFVSKGNGTHAFSATLSEHNKKVYRYQVAPYRRRHKKN